VIRLIADRPPAEYGVAMRSVALKLLLLLAVLLMPLGMAPAAAAMPSHSASMPMGHCPDQAPKHDMKGGIAECTMACAGALPAADLARDEPITLACERAVAIIQHELRGLHPETATPPPRLS
jgi:hypothetical protein